MFLVKGRPRTVIKSGGWGTWSAIKGDQISGVGGYTGLVGFFAKTGLGRPRLRPVGEEDSEETKVWSKSLWQIWKVFFNKSIKSHEQDMQK